jgi:hypothetical protein
LQEERVTRGRGHPGVRDRMLEARVVTHSSKEGNLLRLLIWLVSLDTYGEMISIQEDFSRL